MGTRPPDALAIHRLYRLVHHDYYRESALRQRLCKQCGGWHAFDAWPRECIPQRESKRSPLGAPYIRADGMAATLNHANGRMYDSRSAYEQAVKDAGCVIVGNDIPNPEARTIEAPDEKDVMRDIKTAIEQVEAGHVGH